MADRTGHKSGDQIARYTRLARTGGLKSLVDANSGAGEGAACGGADGAGTHGAMVGDAATARAHSCCDGGGALVLTAGARASLEVRLTPMGVVAVKGTWLRRPSPSKYRPVSGWRMQESPICSLRHQVSGVPRVRH